MDSTDHTYLAGKSIKRLSENPKIAVKSAIHFQLIFIKERLERRRKMSEFVTLMF